MSLCRYFVTASENMESAFRWYLVSWVIHRSAGQSLPLVLLEYSRCSQFHHAKSIAVRGSELASLCSLKDASLYSVYIPTKSEEVHTYSTLSQPHCKSGTRQIRFPSCISCIHINIILFLVQ